MKQPGPKPIGSNNEPLRRVQMKLTQGQIAKLKSSGMTVSGALRTAINEWRVHGKEKD